MVVQRRLAQLVDELLERLVAAADAEFGVVGLALCVARSAVTDAGGMRQQVLDRHVAVRGHELHARVSGPRIDAPDGDFQVAQRRDPARGGRPQREAVLLVQDHHRDAGDRLAHRVDAEERVLRHGFLRFEVAVAVGVEVGDLAAAGDQAGGAGDLPGLDVAVHRRVDAGQAFGREADLLRLRDGDLRVGGQRRGGGKAQGEQQSRRQAARRMGTSSHRSLLSRTVRLAGVGRAMVALPEPARWVTCVSGNVGIPPAGGLRTFLAVSSLSDLAAWRTPGAPAPSPASEEDAPRSGDHSCGARHSESAVRTPGAATVPATPSFHRTARAGGRLGPRRLEDATCRYPSHRCARRTSRRASCPSGNLPGRARS